MPAKPYFEVIFEHLSLKILEREPCNLPFFVYDLVAEFEQMIVEHSDVGMGIVCEMLDDSVRRQKVLAEEQRVSGSVGEDVVFVVGEELPELDPWL